MKVITPALISILLPSCIAGGIGQHHDPGQNYFAGGDYYVSLRLSAPGGNAKRGFNSAQLKIDGLDPIEMARKEASRESVTFVGSVPSSILPAGPFSYSFSYDTMHAGIKQFSPTHNMPVDPKHP